MSEREAALWCAIEAAPDDRLLRDVLADHLRECGRDDEADAVTATAERVPHQYRPRGLTHPEIIWCWLKDGGGEDDCLTHRSAKLPSILWDHTTKQQHSAWWSDHPTFRAAMLDLVRAWVAVRRSPVPA